MQVCVSICMVGTCITTQLNRPLVRFGTPCVGDERYPQPCGCTVRCAPTCAGRHLTLTERSWEQQASACAWSVHRCLTRRAACAVWCPLHVWVASDTRKPCGYTVHCAPMCAERRLTPTERSCGNSRLVHVHSRCVAAQLDGPLVRFGTPRVGDERYPQTMRTHCALYVCPCAQSVV